MRERTRVGRPGYFKGKYMEGIKRSLKKLITAFIAGCTMLFILYLLPFITIFSLTGLCVYFCIGIIVSIIIEKVM